MISFGGETEKEFDIMEYTLCLSGGKDSSFMLELVLNNLDKYPLTQVIHHDLEIDFPWVKNVIAHYENLCIQKGIKFYKLKPTHSFLELYHKYNSMPTRTTRWCNSEYKLSALKAIQGDLGTQYIGLCCNELKRMKSNKMLQYPLIENGVYENTILKWAQNNPIFNDYYLYCTRQGCMYCPMISRMGLAYLYVYYPEHYNTFIQLYRKSEIYIENLYKRPISPFSGNPDYDTKYLNNIIKTKYVPKILEIQNKRSDKI